MPNVSGFLLLLPFFEQDVLYKMYDQKQGNHYPHDVPANVEVMQTTLPIFVCPSDRNELVQVTGSCHKVGENNGGTNYVFNGGIGNKWDWVYDNLAGNYTPDKGGVFLQNGKMRISFVTDGTSNTFAMAETLWVDHADNTAANNGVGGKPGWTVGCATMISFQTGGGINADWGCRGPNTTVDTPKCGPSRAAAFQSEHGGGCNAAFVDGAVRFLSQDISQETLDALATRAASDVANLLD